MSKYKVDSESLTAVADAIRAKTGNDEPLEFPDEFVSEIENIELYPIGYDITNFANYRYNTFVGQNDMVNFHHGTLNKNTGEVVINDEDTSLTGVLESYIPVNPNYQYAKSQDGRMYVLAFYDKDYNFIEASSQSLNNFSYTVLNTFPSNAAYIRFSTHYLTNNWRIKIIRVS